MLRKGSDSELAAGGVSRDAMQVLKELPGVKKNDKGEVVEVHCTYDPATRGGNTPDGRKVKATMHWLSASHSVPAEIRLYNQLFVKPTPDAANFAADLNPQSLEILKDARVEAAIAEANSPDVMQFERQGYFVRDKDSTPARPVLGGADAQRARDLAAAMPPSCRAVAGDAPGTLLGRKTHSVDPSAATRSPLSKVMFRRLGFFRRMTPLVVCELPVSGLVRVCLNSARMLLRRA